MLKFQQGAGEHLLQFIGLVVKNREHSVQGSGVKALIGAIRRNHRVRLQTLLYAMGSSQYR